MDARTHVIEVGGEIDLYSAPELKQRLLGVIDAGKRQVVVDLSEVTFIDSTALGVLVGAVKRLRSADGTLALVCTKPSIAKVFETTGLERVFAIHATRADALAAVAEPSSA